MGSHSMSSADSTHSKEPAQAPASNEYEDAEKNYQPKSYKFWLIILGVYASIFIVALDRMIIATAIPSITDDFHSIQDIGWYGSSYMLSFAVVCPLTGRIFQLYSTKWVYLISIIILEVGSVVCGAAPNSVAFIVGRAIAGAGAAGIFSGGMMVIIPLVPLRKRPMFISFFGIAFGVSSVLGPLIGGAFTDNSHLTWRWCFYINLPIGGFTFAAILFFLNLESPQREKVSLFGQFKRLDPVGLFFFVPSMVSLNLALQWGGTKYAWSEAKMIGLLVTFAVTFIAFIVVEALMPETAMIPPRVVLNRTVAGCMLFVFLLAGGMMAMVYYIAIWFQAAQGQTAIEAGIRTIPLVLALVLFSILAAAFTQRVGYYVPAMLLSVVLCAVGGGLLSTLTPAAGASMWIGYQVLYGVGIGAGFQTSQLGPQTVLPRADVPIGMAMMMTMQQLGGSVFMSVGQNLFSNELIDRLSGIAGLDAQAIVDTGATALREMVPKDELAAAIDAYSYSLTRVFLLTAALSACMILGALPVEWRSIKKEGKGAPKDNEAKPEEGKNEEKSSLTEWKPPLKNPRQFVEANYDKIAHNYFKWTQEKKEGTPRAAYLEKLLSHLPDASKATVLELGCGAGVPGTQILARCCGRVVANDISQVQLELARQHVKQAAAPADSTADTSATTTPPAPAAPAGSNVEFVHGDMSALTFAPATFDAAAALYSVFHLPRAEQGAFLARVAGWLRPGGWLVCNLGAEDMPALVDAWLGGEMFWSSFGAEANVRMFAAAGFEVVESAVVPEVEDGVTVPFQWFVARKK